MESAPSPSGGVFQVRHQTARAWWVHMPRHPFLLHSCHAVLTGDGLGGQSAPTAGGTSYVRSLGKGEDDSSGHALAAQLLGDRNLGPNNWVNLFVQDSEENSGMYNQFEGQVSDIVRKHGLAEVYIRFFYPERESSTPYKPIGISYHVHYTDSKGTKHLIHRFFDN